MRDGRWDGELVGKGLYEFGPYGEDIVAKVLMSRVVMQMGVQIDHEDGYGLVGSDTDELCDGLGGRLRIIQFLLELSKCSFVSEPRQTHLRDTGDGVNGHSRPGDV